MGCVIYMHYSRTFVKVVMLLKYVAFLNIPKIPLLYTFTGIVPSVGWHLSELS
jgi:hypothetical protein